MTNIKKNSVVTLEYILKYDDKHGDIIEVIDAQDPVNVIIGYNYLFEDLENKLLGLGGGDSFSLTLGYEKAYGEYFEDLITSVPMAELMEGVPDEMKKEIREGNTIPVEDEDGEPLSAFILTVENDIVTLDFNVPLAGENLYFEGKVLAVRDATPEEMSNPDNFFGENSGEVAGQDLLNPELYQ